MYSSRSLGSFATLHAWTTRLRKTPLPQEVRWSADWKEVTQEIGTTETSWPSSIQLWCHCPPGLHWRIAYFQNSWTKIQASVLFRHRSLDFRFGKWACFWSVTCASVKNPRMKAWRGWPPVAEASGFLDVFRSRKCPDFCENKDGWSALLPWQTRWDAAVGGSATVRRRSWR